MSGLAVTMSVNSSNFTYFPSARRSSLSQNPKIEIPSENAVTRPAVIGVSGTCGSYPKRSASAIKEILTSVLNSSDGLKTRRVSFSNASPVNFFQDRDLRHWEDHSDGEYEDSGSDTDCPQSSDIGPNDIRSTRNTALWDNTHRGSFKSRPRNLTLISTRDICERPNDLRFTRNKAAWDNEQSPTSTSPLRLISSVSRRPLSGSHFAPTVDSFSPNQHSTLVKSHSFPDAGCVPSNTAQVSSPTADLERAFGSFPSPDPAGQGFKPLHRSRLSTLKSRTGSQQSVGSSHTSLHPAQDTCTFQKRSKSLPVINQAVDPESNPQSLSSQGLYRPTVNLEKVKTMQALCSMALAWWRTLTFPSRLRLRLLCWEEFKTKENEHFVVADLIIAAFENLKCNLRNSGPEHIATKMRTCSLTAFQTEVETRYAGRRKTHSESATSTDSGYDGCSLWQFTPTSDQILEQEDLKGFSEDEMEADDDDDEFVVIENEDYEKALNILCPPDSDESPSYDPDANSAETTALQLYRTFRRLWLEAEEHYQTDDNLRSTKLNRARRGKVCTEFESSVKLVEEIKLKKLRGSIEWAPPRFQIIFSIHPSRKRDHVIAAQHSRCAGCGTEIEPKYNRRLRYCEYLGKYFCDCCHSYAESSIPARVLMKWDFSKYCVSNFAKQLVETIWLSPAFDLLSINPALYSKVRELDKVREQQEQLVHLKKLLKACRLAESTLEGFDQVSSSVTDEQHLFSLDDLLQVKRGLLLPVLKDLVKTSRIHVESCELCQAKGFICEFCRSSDLLFAFQTETVHRCTDCRSCYHKQCFMSNGHCPKCQRIKARKLRTSVPDEQDIPHEDKEDIPDADAGTATDGDLGSQSRPN